MTTTTGEQRPTNWWLRLSAALFVSAAFLGLLLWHLDATLFGRFWSQADPGYLALALALFGANVVVRGLRLARLSNTSDPTTSGRWIRVAARHQVIFSVLPSGLGDASFPALARRLAGVRFWDAACVLVTYRAQDLWALLLLATAGLLLYGQAAGTPLVWFLVAAMCGALLLWSADVTRWVLVLLVSVIGRAPARWAGYAEGLRDLVRRAEQPIAFPNRLSSAALTAVGWTLAAAALWSVFAALGIRLGPAEVVLIMAGLNLVGAAAAFTVAGFGVSEGGLAAILLALGFAGEEAVALAVLVRPASLAMSLLSCGAVDLLTWRLAAVPLPDR